MCQFTLKCVYLPKLKMLRLWEKEEENDFQSVKWLRPYKDFFKHIQTRLSH